MVTKLHIIWLEQHTSTAVSQHRLSLALYNKADRRSRGQLVVC